MIFFSLKMCVQNAQKCSTLAPCRILVCPRRAFSTCCPFFPFFTVRKQLATVQTWCVNVFCIQFFDWYIILLFIINIILLCLSSFIVFIINFCHIQFTLQLMVNRLRQQHTGQGGLLLAKTEGPFWQHNTVSGLWSFE